MTDEIKKRVEMINRGEIPEGYKKTKVGIVPLEWEVCSLEDVCEFVRNGFTYTPYDGDDKVKVTRIETISNRVIDYTCVGYASPNIDNKYRMIKGDILFSHINSYDHIGKTAYYYGEQELYHGMNLLCLRCNKKNSSKYLFNLLCSGKADFVYKSFAKKAVNQCSISSSEVKRITFCFPSLHEQEKIAEILTTQDKLIELQAKKVAELKRLKKAYLQKMFPQNGENVPEIRFKGFTNAWEQRKVGELASVSMNRRIFKEQTTENGDVPFFKIGTFGGIPDAYISRKLFEEYRAKYPYPKVGDILISASGSIGRTVEYSGKDEYFQDSNIVWLNHDERINNSFLKCFFAVVKWAGIEGSTIKRLYNDNILNTEISIPSIEEQSKIGAFFRNLDNLITLHQRELDEMKKKKKALMQLLLTGKVRVKI